MSAKRANARRAYCAHNLSISDSRPTMRHAQRVWRFVTHEKRKIVVDASRRNAAIGRARYIRADIRDADDAVYLEWASNEVKIAREEADL